MKKIIVFLMISSLSIFLYACQKTKTNSEPTNTFRDDLTTVTIESNQLYVLENIGDSDVFIYLKGYGDPYNIYFYSFFSHKFYQVDRDWNRQLIKSKEKIYIHLKKVDSRANDTTIMQFSKPIQVTAIDEVPDPDDNTTIVDFDLSAKYRLTNNTDQKQSIRFNEMFMQTTDDIENRIYFWPENWEHDLPDSIEFDRYISIQPNESYDFKLRVYDRSEKGELEVKQSIVSFYLIDGLTIEKLID